MATMTKQARETIKGYWLDLGERGFQHLTIAGYTRHFFGDAGWQGDKCGCIDNRCIGYHHDDESDCGCLEPCLDMYVKAIRETQTGGTE